MTHTNSDLHSLAQSMRDKGVFIALGVYTAVIGGGWVAFAASFN